MMGHQGLCAREHKAEAAAGLKPLSRQDRSRGQGVGPSSLHYVTRGMWNSFVSKMRGLLGGFGSLLALWSSLKSPVPMFMGIPMMMHSDTPETNQKEIRELLTHSGLSGQKDY